MTQSKNILVAGGGIAGPALALLLTRSGHKVTIVERAAKIRPTGQQIDISGSGQEVARFMGIEEQLKKLSVHEQGLRFVDTNNGTIAEFGLAQVGGRVLTQEIEIMRGDMAQVLHDQIKDAVEYVFGDYITALAEKESCITVSFDKAADRDFDLVVAADGLFSKTREMAFGKDAVTYVDLKTLVALFTIPYESSDGDWCRAYNTTGGRSVNMRPRNRKVTGAYLTVQTEDSSRLARLPADEQKAALKTLFKGAGWEAERALHGLDITDDFYATAIAQVKAPSWSKGRVVLLGDAGYAPSPMTGKGTTLAYTGAYILAGCIATYPDHREAFAQYEKEMRPWVDKLQSLPPGVPYIALPKSVLGVWALRTGAWLVSLAFYFKIASALSWVAQFASRWFESDKMELPKYAGLK